MQYPTHTELIALSQSETIQEINQINRQIDELRPLSKEQEDQIMQKLRLDWNYNSNAIEGNSLDYGETVAFLMHGITAKGKPLKDYLDIRGHNEAINYLLDLVQHNEDITEKDIRAIHEMVLVEPYKSTAQTSTGQNFYKTIELGKYKSSPNHVRTITGEIHYYASPEDTPILMGELMEWYRFTQTFDDVHPVVIAAIFHHHFASIHPFDDGNGRMARLLMNLILMKYKFPPVVIKKVTKDQYYLALSLADNGDIKYFIDYISDSLLSTVSLYLRGAKGENIEEPADLDKKLMLFKQELEARKDRVEIRRSDEIKLNLFNQSFDRILKGYILILAKFKDLFIDYNEYMVNFLDPESGEEMWKYKPFPIMDSPHFYKLMADDDVVVLCSQYKDFKIDSNNFSLEVKLVIFFDELEYRLYYTISKPDELKEIQYTSYSQWLGEPSIVKYYHQNIQQTEEEAFLNDVGNGIYEYVQDVYKDPKVKDIHISPQEIIDVWDTFLASDYSDKPQVEEALSGLESVEIEENRITIEISADNIDMLSEDLDNVALSFNKFLVRTEMVKGRFLVDVI